MKNTQKTNSDKRTYEKPNLRTIDLVAEEVLALGCKQPSGSLGPIGTSCVSSPKCNKNGS